MNALELKLPPPLLAVITAALMYGIARFSGNAITYDNTQILLLCVLVGLGFLIDMMALISFRRARTTILPFCPERSSTLVISGVYRFSRNPMYLGLMMIITGWAFFLGSVWNVFIWIGCFMYLTVFQIKPEERVLLNVFGEEYQHYLSTVRRWI